MYCKSIGLRIDSIVFTAIRVTDLGVIVPVENKTESRRELVGFRVTNAWKGQASTKGEGHRDCGLERINKTRAHKPGKEIHVISSKSEFARGGQVVKWLVQSWIKTEHSHPLSVKPGR